jgi:hypothetical protein
VLREQGEERESARGRGEEAEGKRENEWGKAEGTGKKKFNKLNYSSKRKLFFIFSSTYKHIIPTQHTQTYTYPLPIHTHAHTHISILFHLYIPSQHIYTRIYILS